MKSIIPNAAAGKSFDRVALEKLGMGISHLDEAIFRWLWNAQLLSENQDVLDLAAAWQAERRPREDLLHYLVRAEVLAGGALAQHHLPTERHSDWLGLVSDAGRETLTKILLRGATRRADAPPLLADELLTTISGTDAAPTKRLPKILSDTPTLPNVDQLVSLPDPTTHRPQPGQVWGRCRLVEPIGQGGLCTVFLALHTTLGTTVAVKFLNSNVLAGQPGRIDQLRTEARLLARMNHPNLLRVLDFDDNAACPYMVSEFVDGFSLADMINQSGRLQPLRALEVIRQAARGLQAAAALDVIHRDVKPGNILLARGEGVVKLADFGLGASLDALAADPGVGPDRVVGTVVYMPPEQARGEPATTLSDQYALGVTFFHALTGRVPFYGETALEVMLKHQEADPPRADEVCAEVPPSLAAVVHRMMAKNPAHRFATYDELLATLDWVEKELREAPSLRRGRITKLLRRLIRVDGWPQPNRPTP